jgi:peptidoglycan/LPS O-acetylase OafA/YrhL/lysophospholipase L1-like esterase
LILKDVPPAMDGESERLAQVTFPDQLGAKRSGAGGVVSERNSGWAYRPALDGVRALAVTAVILYHLNYGWMRGGFLGVDTFFVLSGYLITSLLLVEWESKRAIRLLAFWGRRARRLLPALFLLLAVTAVAGAAWTSRLELTRLRGDALSGLFYVANWRFIASGQSYFDQFSAPSPLRHLWSLAIEEQFYLVWPIVVLTTMRVARHRARALAAICIGGIIASATAMALLYHAADPSRVYYGTDTRAQTILVGALLAVALRHQRFDGRAVRTTTWIGTASLVGVVLCFARVSQTSWVLYHGGSLLFACLVVPVVVMAVGPAGGLAVRILTLAPLRWVGRVSYGLYLWHWPMIVWLTPARVGFGGVALDALRVGAAVAAAAASYYLVEQPIRHASFATLPRRFGAITTAALVAIALLATTADAQAQPSYYRTGKSGPRRCTPTASETSAYERAVGNTGGRVTAPRSAHRILVIGDSVACSLYPALRALTSGTSVTVGNGTVVGCGITGDDYDELTGTFITCHDYAGELQRAAYAQTRPEVVVWSSTWERTAIRVDGKTIRPESPTWPVDQLHRVDAVVRTLTSAGARVVILTQPPFGDAADPTTHTATAGSEEFYRLNALLIEYAKRHPATVSVVDMAGRVCPTRCIQKVGGAAVRSDGAHFSPTGAVWVARWILPQLTSSR